MHNYHSFSRRIYDGLAATLSEDYVTVPGGKYICSPLKSKVSIFTGQNFHFESVYNKVPHNRNWIFDLSPNSFLTMSEILRKIISMDDSKVPFLKLSR